VLEIDTPVVATAATTEPHLDSMETIFRGQTHYLNTSPEFSMKRFLAAYRRPAYQICKAFRVDELGPMHNPEFTMLEWYRPGFDMHQLMDEIEELLSSLFETGKINAKRLSYRHAFEQYAGINPHTATAEQCRDCAQSNGIEQPVGLDNEKDEWLDWLLVTLVLPSFKNDAFTFLYDFPASQCSLAQLRQDESGIAVASRFELYYGEVELANGFHELRSSKEQRQRFEKDNTKRRSAGRNTVKIDEYLLEALSYGLPDCSGVAMGLERLLMIICNETDIEKVLLFPWSRA